MRRRKGKAVETLQYMYICVNKEEKGSCRITKGQQASGGRGFGMAGRVRRLRDVTLRASPNNRGAVTPFPCQFLARSSKSFRLRQARVVYPQTVNYVLEPA